MGSNRALSGVGQGEKGEKGNFGRDAYRGAYVGKLAVSLIASH